VSFISLMIYLFGVVGNIGFVLAALVFVCGLAMVFIHGCVALEDGTYGLKEMYETFPVLKKVWGAIIISVIILIFLPTQRTLLLVAATEVGTTVFKDVSTAPISKKSIEFLEKWIDKETSKLMTEESKK
jgi:hypothetical protein